MAEASTKPQDTEAPKTPEEIEALLYSGLPFCITLCLTNRAQNLRNTSRENKPYKGSSSLEQSTALHLQQAPPKAHNKHPCESDERILSSRRRTQQNLCCVGTSCKLPVCLCVTPQDEMQVDESNESKEITPEVEVFLQLLALVFLIDSKKYKEGVEHSEWVLDHLMSNWNRRTLDPLSAKIYFYYSRAHELHGDFADIRPYDHYRKTKLTFIRKLLQYQRTATLRHNFDGQVVLLNLLLRNYLHYKLYEQGKHSILPSDSYSGKARGKD